MMNNSSIDPSMLLTPELRALARKDKYKHQRRATRRVLMRTTAAYRVSSTASVTAIAVAMAVCLAAVAAGFTLSFVVGPAAAGRWVDEPATFCCVEALLAAVAGTAAFLLHRRAARLQVRLNHATRALARARAKLAELRADTLEAA
ncbi:hypothetical protein [Paraburkholderia dilworthii]|uniref:Holin-X, holin superfamily III n=1 Tax=Paraburkholderia dilworthii TaxID=948106 RepID=A0ABW9D559_9BURK